MIVFDVVKDKLAVLEANKLNIPVIAILDTNSDPEFIEYPIPSNDDAIRSINLYAELFRSTMLDAKKNLDIENKMEDNSLIQYYCFVELLKVLVLLFIWFPHLLF